VKGPLFESSAGNRVRANFGRSIIINLASYFGGIAIAAVGVFIHSLPVIRIGLLLLAVGAAAGAVMRLLAFASLGKRVPFYGAISVGLRLAAAVALAVIAITVRF
jgi:hypothetical protein